MDKQKRQFIKSAIYSSITLTLGTAISMQVRANPLVWVWRILFGFGARRTAGRMILSNTTRNAIRSSSTRSSRSLINKFVTLHDIHTLTELSGVFSAVTPEAHASLTQFQSKAIWLDSVANSLTLDILNHSNSTISSEMGLLFQNLETQDEFLLGPIYLNRLPPNSNTYFPDDAIKINPLKKGTYLITPICKQPELIASTIGPITVLNKNQIQFHSS